MKSRIILSLVFMMSCISSVGSAQDLRLDLRVGALVLPDESIDFVSNGNTVPTQTLRVSSELLPDTRVIIEYGSDAPQKVTRHQEVETRFLRHRFMAGADWGPTLFGFLRPFGGATVGYTLGFVEFETSEIRYDDYSHDILADIYLGSEVNIDLIGSWYVSGGFRFGMRLQTPAEFDELSTERDDEDPWERTDPNLGTLYPNGWYVDFGAGIGWRF